MDYAFLGFLLTLGTLIGTILLRKRILAAIGRLLFAKSVEFVRSTYFVETEEDTDEGVKRVLRPSGAFLRLSSAVVPMLVQTALKSVKFKTGGNLPINPATGQLDFMAPVLTKMASGKKIGLEDFLPLIMDKAMPFLERFMGGMGGGGPSATTGKLPEHLIHASK